MKMAPHGAISIAQALELIPRRREAGIDATPVLRLRGDFLAVGIVERDLERVEIGLLARGAKPSDCGDAVLVEQPFQRDLRGGRLVPGADLGQYRIRGDTPLRQRTISDERNRLGLR